MIIMEFPALKEAQGKLDTERKALRDVFTEAGKDMNMDNVKSVAGDRNAKVDWIRNQNEKITELKGEVEKLKGVAQIAEEQKAFEDAHGSEFKGADERETKDGESASLGELFTKSAAYTNRGQKSTLDYSLKTLFQRTAGWSPEVVRSGLVTLKPQVPAPSVTDHLVTIPVSQSGYKYMEETTYTTGAAEISEGATFGEAVLQLTERSQTVEKVAVWIPVTDEQLEDEPGARAYVEARLENMLRQRLDLQVLQGDGNTPNILGTINKSGIQTRALGADTLIDASYKLFTTIRTDGFAEPSVGFLQASSWQPVMLLKTADGQYIWGNPASGGPSTLWGVPIVLTQAAVSGTFVTGDYSNYAFLGVKRGLDMQITNSHGTQFIEGKQAIRVDTRVVMVHIRPKAFGTVTGV